MISADSSQQNSARDVDNYSSSRNSLLISEYNQLSLRNMGEDGNIENEELQIVEEFETEYKKSERSLTQSSVRSKRNHSSSNIIDQDSVLIHMQDESIDETHDISSIFLEKELCYFQDPSFLFEGKPFVVFSKNNKIQNCNKVERFDVDIIKAGSADQTHELDSFDYKGLENTEKIKNPFNQLIDLRKDVKAFMNMNDLNHKNNERIADSSKTLWNIDKRYVEVTSAVDKLYWNKMGGIKNSTSAKLISDVKIKNENIAAKSDDSSSDSDYCSNQSTQQADMKSIYPLNLK